MTRPRFAQGTRNGGAIAPPSPSWVVQFPVLYVVGDVANERGQKESAGRHRTRPSAHYSVLYSVNPGAMVWGAFPLDLSPKEPPRE